MNPYAGESEVGAMGHVGLVSVASPISGFETAARKQGTRTTLSGPFVAELQA
jgi:hypothetical protein